MKRTIAGIVLAAVMAVSVASAAQAAQGVDFEDGNDLYAKCNSPYATMNWFMCLGYVECISDALGSGSSINGYTACMPAGASAGQAMDVVKQFLTAHPELRHFIAAGLVASALANAFPCQR